MKYKFCCKTLNSVAFWNTFLRIWNTPARFWNTQFTPYCLITELNLSEVRYYHLNKAPQKLQAVENDYDTADNINNAKYFVGDFGTE